MIDVMMPVAHKDMEMMPVALEHLVTHCRDPIRHIVVVWQGHPGDRAQAPPAVRLTGPRSPEVIFIDEQIYPFTKEQIRRILETMDSRANHAGWYYQQLLKLYAFRTIPDLCSRLLVHDADVVFMEPVSFLDREDRSLLSYGYPFRWVIGADEPTAYGSVEETSHSHVEHARRLVPGWQLGNVFSGMQHHQLMERDILEELLQRAEHEHGVPFWEAFIRQVDCSKWNSASEYVLYFHHAIHHHPERVSPRHLHGIDVIHDADEPLRDSPATIADGERPALIGRHGFTALRSRLETMDYIPAPLRRQLLEPPRDRLAFRLELREGILQLDLW